MSTIRRAFIIWLVVSVSAAAQTQTDQPRDVGTSPAPKAGRTGRFRWLPWRADRRAAEDIGAAGLDTRNPPTRNQISRLQAEAGRPDTVSDVPGDLDTQAQVPSQISASGPGT